MAHGVRLKLRLFLEGVEVPVIAANVQVAPNSPAVATIQIPPLPEACNIKPRTLVHLFFLDFYEVANPLLKNSVTSATAVSNNTANPTAYEQTITGGTVTGDDTRNEQYKLLFGGEVLGFQYTKNERSRSMVLQCSDFSNYWDYAYQFSNTDIFGPGIKALFAGGATNLFTDFLDDDGSVIARILKTPSVQYPGLKGLLGGIVHLLEAIGGSYYYNKKFAGQNIFFSLAELRLHITQMITAYENDPTAGKLLNAHGFDGMFNRTLGNLGAQISFRSAINALMSHIFHETYAIPTPRYVPGTAGTISGGKLNNIANDPSTAFIATTAAGVVQTLQQVQQGLTTPLDPTVIQRLSAASTTLRTTTQQIKAKNVQQAVSSFASAQTSIGSAVAKLQSAGSSPSTISAVQGLLNNAITQLQSVANIQVTTPAAKTAVPARLNQHIFRPDVWFSAPPMCNVLFPDMYFNVNYARMFLQEPTRLLLKTNDEFFGEDELFDSYYFAPKGYGLKTNKNSLAAILTNDVLDHEVYTGIIPVFEKMGELNIFSIRSGNVGNGKVPKVGLAQRSANFLYFKYRFNARQMQISARFSPYIAPGFPGLLMDSYADGQTLQQYNQLVKAAGGTPTRAINKLLGVHFLGNFTEVVHSVDQQSGRTDITCGYARQPDESVEFLGIIADGQTVQQRSSTNTPTSTDVAALSPPRMLSVGPNGGQITSVMDVTDKYKPSFNTNWSVDFTMDLPLFLQGKLTQSRVAIGVTQPPGAFNSPDVTKLAGSSAAPLTFRAYAIVEQAPSYQQTTVDLPAEEYIRPGWYGDCWHPSQIGQVYQQFFATGAITDPITLTSPSGGSTTVPNQAASDSLAQASQAQSAADPRAQAPAALSLATNSSIEQAVAFLALTYSYIRSGGFDTEEFFRAYSWRPIATMVDMFGSSDLQLSTDGATVTQGIEGFHSRAFGPFNNLFGLVTPDTQSIVGIQKGSPAATKGDKRKDKQDAVLAYVQALQFSRAIIG